MEKYKDHIAIIGSGIAGLTIGCILLKEGVPSVIFEKHSELGSHGAGISLSPNALRVLRYMGLKDEVEKISKLTLTTRILDNTKTLYTSSSNVRTTSREMLYKILLNKYESYGGKIIYNHELRAIDSDSSKVFFLNNSNFLVKHVIACDGIKSVSRNSISESASIPSYSGYSAWRGIIKSEDNSINLHLSKNSHIVSYPIDNEFTSFVAVIKTANEYKEAWKTEGSVDEMKADLSMHPTKLVNRLAKSNEVFKWGIYKRRDVNKLFVKNITFLGDAAHPIVPFLGQGGCMAIEDAYTFGVLTGRLKSTFSEVQVAYEKLRLERNNKIQSASVLQGQLNHIQNPIIAKGRNLVMKHTPILSIRTKKIWDYDADAAIEKFLVEC